MLSTPGQNIMDRQTERQTDILGLPELNLILEVHPYQFIAA